MNEDILPAYRTQYPDDSEIQEELDLLAEVIENTLIDEEE